MIKRMILMLAVMTLVVGGVIGFKLFGRHMMNAAMASAKPPPAVVATADAKELPWRRTLHSVGSFSATEGIMVCAQLDGAVTKIAFVPGGTVAAGDLLVQQDISTELAQLEGAEAGATLASLNLARAKELRAHDTNAQSDLDAATAAAHQAEASVGSIKSTIAKKTVRAPFAGRVGVRQVSTGEFLRSGAPMVSLQALDPIYFNFALPQQNIAVLARDQHVAVTVDAYPGQSFDGAIVATNPNVDAATRTLQVQAALSNSDGRLQPGMFGSVEVQLPAEDKVVTIPLAAIVYNPYGDAVYVVQPDPKDARGLTVRQQFVQVGVKRGDQVAILKGLAAGATVVTAGQLKLRNGSSVIVNNSIVAADGSAPQPDHP